MKAIINKKTEKTGILSIIKTKLGGALSGRFGINDNK